ncbi:MAG: SMP-30/gluconolactonase/LRE family protein [Bacteroidota bacterium]
MEKALKKMNDPAFEILDEEAYKIFDVNAQLEVLDSGYIWTEGPLWLKATNQLLFNDIPANKTYVWSESEGTKVYLSPSGYTSDLSRNGEPGANGLVLNAEGKLILCQHGDRRVALMNAPIESPTSDFTTIVDNYKGEKFSSPNDATFSKHGNLYFTDPPYGLSNPEDQETSFNGVYRFSKDGNLTVIDSTLTRPNGIAFSPDHKTLYVANSDPNLAIWMKYNMNDKTGIQGSKTIFFNATEYTKTDKGLPDGLKVNSQGYVFATGPGGVWVFNPDGKALARIKTGQATSNCAFGASENVLYLTADDYIMRATFQ